jgi:hypothetical protein
MSARSDTKLARIEGKLDLVVSKLDAVLNDNQKTVEAVRDDGRATRSNAWVIGIGLAAIIVALVVALPAFIGLGIQMRDFLPKLLSSLPK